jgi:3-deoxy-manno-octulosonate cytidylyltransferase (CMP-KDO synthetase)
VNGLYIPYFKHLGIYAYRSWFLQEYARTPEGILERAESLEQLRAIEYGWSIKVGLTEIDSPSVDTPADLRRVHGIVREHGGCCG